MYVQTEACFLLYTCMYILHVYKNVLMCICIYKSLVPLPVLSRRAPLVFVHTLRAIFKSRGRGGAPKNKTNKGTQVR